MLLILRLSKGKRIYASFLHKMVKLINQVDTMTGNNQIHIDIKRFDTYNTQFYTNIKQFDNDNNQIYTDIDQFGTDK